MGRLLSLQHIQGHPNAENIFQGIMQVIGPNGINISLQKLVSFLQWCKCDDFKKSRCAWEIKERTQS